MSFKKRQTGNEGRGRNSSIEVIRKGKSGKRIAGFLKKER